jgi:hypothetical protein
MYQSREDIIMKKKLLSMVMVLAFVLGCVTALGYKNVSASPKVAANPMEDLVEQIIKMNQHNYVDLKPEGAHTILKVELAADGTFKLECPHSYAFSGNSNAIRAQLKDELGNLKGKEKADESTLEWKDLEKGIYYVEIWSNNSKVKKAGVSTEVDFYASSEPSNKVVLDIGISLKKGKSLQLTKIFSPDNCDEDKMVWEPDDTNIATVSKSGKVKAKAKGETYIRLKLGSTLMARIKVTVTAK